MATQCPICLCEINDNSEECPACGFKFSGTTQKFRPVSASNEGDSILNDGVRESSNSPHTNNTNAILRVISGPQGEILLPLSKDKMTIGRSPNSDIFLNDRTVSREHAIVAKQNDNYQIIDCDSYNGLWINNQNKTIANLNDGDIIQIGVFFLKFESKK